MDTLLKIVQIGFYITAASIGILTYLKAKNGLLNTVNTEYQKKVIDRLAELSTELLDEFDSIVRALLNRYGVTRPRCTQCTICGRSPCSDSKIP